MGWAEVVGLKRNQMRRLILKGGVKGCEEEKNHSEALVDHNIMVVRGYIDAIHRLGLDPILLLSATHRI